MLNLSDDQQCLAISLLIWCVCVFVWVVRDCGFHLTPLSSLLALLKLKPTNTYTSPTASLTQSIQAVCPTQGRELPEVKAKKTHTSYMSFCF